MRAALEAEECRPIGEKFLYPVRLEPCELPEKLKHCQWVDLFKPDGLNRLVAVLKRNRAQPDIEFKREPEAIRGGRSGRPSQQEAEIAAAIKRGNYVEAAAELTRALEDSPGNARLLLMRGRAWLGEFQYALAAADLEKATHLLRDDAGAFYVFAIAASRIARTDEAIEALNRACTLDPGRRASYEFTAGLILAGQGRLPEALERFTEAIELAPNVARYYVERAKVYRWSGRMAEAGNDDGKAAALDPTLLGAFYDNTLYEPPVDA